MAQDFATLDQFHCNLSAYTAAAGAYDASAEHLPFYYDVNSYAEMDGHLNDLKDFPGFDCLAFGDRYQCGDSMGEKSTGTESTDDSSQQPSLLGSISKLPYQELADDSLFAAIPSLLYQEHAELNLGSSLNNLLLATANIKTPKPKGAANKIKKINVNTPPEKMDASSQFGYEPAKITITDAPNEVGGWRIKPDVKIPMPKFCEKPVKAEKVEAYVPKFCHNCGQKAMRSKFCVYCGVAMDSVQ